MQATVAAINAAGGIETRTYSVWRKCGNGQQAWEKVDIQSPEIVAPADPTPEQIAAYNAAMEKQNDGDMAQILAAAERLKHKCSERAVRTTKPTGTSCTRNTNSIAAKLRCAGAVSSTATRATEVRWY